MVCCACRRRCLLMGADLSREAKVDGPLEAPRLLKIAVIIDSSKKIGAIGETPTEARFAPNTRSWTTHGSYFTSPNSASRPRLSRCWGSKHQTHFLRPSSSNQDHPAWTLVPSPLCRSWDQRGCGEGICIFPWRLPSAALHRAGSGGRADTRSSLPSRGSSHGRKNPCSDQLPGASR